MPERNSIAGLLADRKVLVTGATRGLGLAFAKSIAEAGGAAVLTDILDERVREEAAALRVADFDAYGFTLDLDDPTSIQTCAAATTQALDGLGGLVSNATVTNPNGRNASSIGIETWNHVINVSVRGTWLITTACLPALKALDRGAIINLSSDTPLWGAPNLLAYVTSESAVIGMTKSLARECGADGIIANAITPGLTLVEAAEYVPTHRHALYCDRRAVPRNQLSDNVYGAVLFALSNFSRFVTDQTLAINGDFVMQ